jgi:DNA-binding response OmpR family regulator
MSAIMVVEDNNELQHYLCAVLRGAGHTVIGVSTAQKGMEALRNERYEIELLMLDVQLGDGTAFEFLESLKQINPLFDPKICFVSSRRDTETIKRAVSFGAADYIVKPILSGTLLTKVSALLGAKESPEIFASASCQFVAQLIGSDAIQPDIMVTEVTEAGIRLRSSVRLQEGALIPLNIEELQQLLEHDGDHLIFRIQKSEKLSWGKYSAQAEFVGLADARVAKLRALTIRGAFISKETLKKMA